MAVNLSSSSNDSLPSLTACHITSPSSLIFITYYITNFLLLLPLCMFVLYLGLQRWRRQRSTSTAAAVTSHSDIFTYHMVAMELLGLVGITLVCCSIYEFHIIILKVGYHLWAFTWYGEISFHILTCVERYLAVVRPVTYLSLRGERGIRIRNISIGCVWLFGFVAMGLITEGGLSIVDFCILILSLIIVSFCSLSVLCVLIRPGPGEQGGDRERVDQSKQRAFYTIVAILGVLLLKCLASLIWAIFHMLKENECVVMTAEAWFNLPSLVLPLLFLHKAGTLACCKN